MKVTLLAELCRVSVLTVRLYYVAGLLAVPPLCLSEPPRDAHWTWCLG